jgi:hypothetical protein
MPPDRSGSRESSHQRPTGPPSQAHLTALPLRANIRRKVVLGRSLQGADNCVFQECFTVYGLENVRSYGAL